MPGMSVSTIEPRFSLRCRHCGATGVPVRVEHANHDDDCARASMQRVRARLDDAG